MEEKRKSEENKVGRCEGKFERERERDQNLKKEYRRQNEWSTIVRQALVLHELMSIMIMAIY